MLRFDPEIPVFDRHAKSFPTHGEQASPAFYGSFSEAVKQQFGWDAHFSAYSLPSVEHRLATQAALELGPKMSLFVVDVDGPNHVCTPEWWAGEREKIRKLFKARGWGYAYSTKGGYRLVYGFRPFELKTPADAQRWSASYKTWLELLKHDFWIVGDEACADWTRCFRLPRVTRDGELTTTEEIGEPDRMTCWGGDQEILLPADDPRCLRTNGHNGHAVAATPVQDSNVEAAVTQLSAIWPKRGRHVASLALCGALAKAGWEEDAIADFVTAVSGLAASDDGDYTKRLAQARSSLDKVSRGEDVSGWTSLEECLGTDAAPALREARRMLGQGPPIDLFIPLMDKPPLTLKEQLDAACAEAGGDADFRVLLDEAAAALKPLIDSAESKSTTDVRPMGMTGREIMASDDEPPGWLVQNLIPSRGVGALSGEPKSGKSWDLTHCAIAISAGKPVFGQFPVQRAASVFYYYSEDPQSSIKNRMRAIAKGLEIDPDGPWLERFIAVPKGRTIDVMVLTDLCVLVASVWRFARRPGAAKIELVVLDPMSNIHSGEEDKRDSMKPVMARLHALEQLLGATILFAHHSAKSSNDNKGRKRGGQRMRGSSAIHGAIDFGIYLDNLRGDSKTEFIARVESEVKSARPGGVFDRRILIEDNEHGNAIKATFTWGEHQEGDAVKPDKLESKMIDILHSLFDHSERVTYKQLHRKVGGNDGEFSKALEAAIEEKLIIHRRPFGYEISEDGREVVRLGRQSSQPSEPELTKPAPTWLAAFAPQLPHP